jgi:hypothetical protein
MDSQNVFSRTNDQIAEFMNVQRQDKRNMTEAIPSSYYIENQIEDMLDKIIGNENEGNDFNFSDDDDEEDSFSDPKTNNPAESNNSSIFNSALIFNSSNISEEPEQPNNFHHFQRENKKFLTISFNNANSFNSPLNNIQSSSTFTNFNTTPIRPQFHNNKLSIQNQQTTPQMSNQFIMENQYLFNKQFKRTNQRKKTYDTLNQLNFQSNKNIIMNPNSSKKLGYGMLYPKSSLNSLSTAVNNPSPLYTSVITNNTQYANTNNNISMQSPIFNNSPFLISDVTQNEKSIQYQNYSPTVNNNKRKIKNQNEETNAHHKQRFCTTTFPKGTNMQIEMLLYELNTALSKTEKIDYYIYGKLQGNFVEVIKTHKGSRIFQNYLKNTHSDIIHQIFVEICPHLSEIISDAYANYFCKRFFSYLNQKERIEFLTSIQSSLIKLSMDNIGTYPIQSIIEQVGSKVEKKLITNSLQPATEELCYNTYGTRVLEKVMTCFEEEFSSFIYDYVSNNFLHLSTNVNGICLIKRALTLTHKKELHESMKKLSFENAVDLIQHVYGNYVIQVIVENWENCEINDLVLILSNKFVYFSMQKYSSNVVERLIEKSENVLTQFIKELCESERIAEVMKNNFGNYVIQKALKISNGDNLRLLLNDVLCNISKLNDKKLIAKWKSIVNPYLLIINKQPLEIEV